MTILDASEVKKELITWLGNQDTVFHLTLSFHANTNHTETKKLLNLFFKHLNRRIFKKRYNDRKNFIFGIVIREETPELNTDHYHTLIIDKDKALPDFDRFHVLVRKVARNLKGKGLRNRNHIKSIYLQPYTNEEGTYRLESYLLKNISNINQNTHSAFDAIACLGPDNIVFGRDFNRVH